MHCRCMLHDIGASCGVHAPCVLIALLLYPASSLPTLLHSQSQPRACSLSLLPPASSSPRRRQAPAVKRLQPPPTAAHLTPAQAAEAGGALQMATRWCSAAGAVTMVLAILLECRRRSRSRNRRALYAAIACAAADHYVATSWLYGLLVVIVNSPGGLGLLGYTEAAIAVIYAVVDILTLLALILGVGEDSEED